MTCEQISGELEGEITAGFPLRRIVSTLRKYRDVGVTRHEVQMALEALRDQVRDEAAEDRLLEIMDIVSGFCSRENTIWDG